MKLSYSFDLFILLPLSDFLLLWLPLTTTRFITRTRTIYEHAPHPYIYPQSNFLPISQHRKHHQRRKIQAHLQPPPHSHTIHHPGLRLILASFHLSVVADSVYTHAAEYRAWSVTGLGLQCAKRYTKCNCSRCYWKGTRNRSNGYLMFVDKPQIPKQSKHARQQAVGIYVRYVHPSARPSVKTGSLAISDGVSPSASLTAVVYLCAFAFNFARSASTIDFAPVL